MTQKHEDGAGPGGVAVHLTVRGLVQGVGFRAAARRRALQLHLAGWVRNADDGSVEALAVGTEEAVRRFRQWCRTGPPAAEVRTVVARPVDGGTAWTRNEFLIIR